ncbi:HAD family hydrolase [Atopobium minutum]|uniref:HAD family hydrolase n=1 Tax=Atopobium minutum TaxID=1381 RepID=UPI0025EE1318|nr:HAD family phosphatase [Atopobium minutum]
MAISGAIFDCDGTLVDSMYMWWDAFPRLLASHGFAMTPQIEKILHECEAVSLDEEIHTLRNALAIPASAEQLAQELSQNISNAYASEIKAWPAVKPFLYQLKDAGIPMIICTSTGAKEVGLCMDHLGLSKFFVDIVSAEENNFTKTEPDIYYYALKKLGTTKETTWVFEDAPFGLTTSERAGFPNVCVFNAHDKRDEDFLRLHATLFTHIYEDISLADLQSYPTK